MSRSIRSTLVKGAREVIPPAAYRLRLPQRSYEADGIVLAPVAGSVRYTMERPHLDALDALRHNAATVLSALTAAGVDHFVVRCEWGERPTIGVLAEQLDRVYKALAWAGRDEPVYASPDATSASLVRLHPRRPTPHLGDRFNVFTHLTDQRTNLHYSGGEGCIVEVWMTQPDGSIVRASDKGVTPRFVPPGSSDEPIPTDVYGHQAVTYAPLDRPPVFSVRFPIDIVYMWVDGEDEAWLARKAERLASQGADVARDAERPSRFRQFDELRYSLRSMERFAPWVRHIFLVTDQQRPSWLREEIEGLTVVDHREIFPPTAVPTFNSHAITTALHRIPGLSDHFLIFNDDVFLGRPVNPGRFFLGNGTGRFFVSQTSVAPIATVPHEAARIRTCDVIEEVTGTRPTRVMKHIPPGFNRQLLASLEEDLADLWHDTMHSPFRSPTDIVPELLHAYVGYDRGLTVPSGKVSYGYFAFGGEAGTASLSEYEGRTPVDVFCINDVGGEEVDDAQAAELASFLEGQFPHPSRFERPSQRPMTERPC